MKLVHDAYYGFWSFVYFMGMAIAIPSGMVAGWENLFVILWLPFIVVVCTIIKYVYILTCTFEYIMYGDPNDDDYRMLTEELYGFIFSYVKILGKEK